MIRRLARRLCEINLSEGPSSPEILLGIATDLTSAQEVWPEEVGEAWRADHS